MDSVSMLTAGPPVIAQNPTFHPTDQSDTTGQIFLESLMIPTPPDESDHMHPSFNPKALGSRPRRPTSWPMPR
jgi:hypothetical protein